MYFFYCLHTSIMKAYLFLLSFIGVVPVTLPLEEPGVRKYYVIMTKVTQPDAQKYCRKTYTDLATVNSDLEWLRLKEEVARKGLTDVAWVGLYNDIDSWRWSSNGVPLKNTFTNWRFGEPDNSLGKESCCASGTGGNWWDCPCTDLFPFICFNDRNTGTERFIGVTTQMSWNDAQAYCRKIYTDLATVTSVTENDMVQKIAYSQGKSWIGLYRDTWKWSDGTNTSNILWGSGLPNNYYNQENCAVLNKNTFHDRLCNNLYSFICHAYPREKQIVKLQVRSDGSIRNSDVQAIILKLIKQKLEENGTMGNTTVTWRVQTNGQIFNKKVKRP